MDAVTSEILIPMAKEVFVPPVIDDTDVYRWLTVEYESPEGFRSANQIYWEVIKPLPSRDEIIRLVSESYAAKINAFLGYLKWLHETHGAAAVIADGRRLGKNAASVLGAVDV